MLQWIGQALAFSEAAVDPAQVGTCAGSPTLWADPSLEFPSPGARLKELRILPGRGSGPYRVALLRRNHGDFSLEALSDLLAPEEDVREGFRADLDLTWTPSSGSDSGAWAPVVALVTSCEEGYAPSASSEESVHSGSWRDALRWTLEDIESLHRGMALKLQDAHSSSPPLLAPSFAIGFEPLFLDVEEEARRGGAVQVLGQVSDEAKCSGLESIVESVLVTSKHCSWLSRYPVFIEHTAQMEGISLLTLLHWMDRLRAVRGGATLKFLDVSDEFQRVRIGDAKVRLEDLDLLWMDITRNDSAAIRKAKPRRFKTGYRHMCRFQTSSFLESPAFAQYRYLLHMDSDAALTCKEDGVDPIEEMRSQRAVYGLFEVGIEDPAFTDGWTTFVEEYTLLHDVVPQVEEHMLSTAAKFVTKENSEGDQLVEVPVDKFAATWGTGWEVLDLAFFNSPTVLEFSHKAERSLGHYRFNWGDHLIRAYQVMLFAPLSQVRCFDHEELPGYHGCNGIDEEYGSQDVYQLLEGLVCPHDWTGDIAPNIPWEPPLAAPRACLELCNQVDACAGFDMMYMASEGVVNCAFRFGRASPETCLDQEEEMLGAWLSIFPEMQEPPTMLAATNKFRLIERTLERSFSCQAWQESFRDAGPS